jgi:hypothetical protein
VQITPFVAGSDVSVSISGVSATGAAGYAAPYADPARSYAGKKKKPFSPQVFDKGPAVDWVAEFDEAERLRAEANKPKQRIVAVLPPEPAFDPVADDAEVMRMVQGILHDLMEMA